MGEVGAIAACLDMLPGCPVNIAKADSGTNHGLCSFIGFPNQVVDGGVLFICGFTEVGAGHVGAVTIFDAAHIDDNAVAGF